MKDDLIKEAVDLGKKLGHVLLTTCDNNGVAHLSVAAEIDIVSGGRLSVSEWFCPGMTANLENNPNIGVIVWDKESDFGYQLLGRKESSREIAILDGYAPKIEKKSPLPQVKREVVINVEKILEFKQAPHSDRQEY